MPVTKQAIKKVRQDRRKTVYNLRRKRTYKEAVSALRKNPTAEGLVKAYKALDLAAKTNVIHKNKAARLKSRLARLVASGKAAPRTVAKPKKSKVKKSPKVLKTSATKTAK